MRWMAQGLMALLGVVLLCMYFPLLISLLAALAVAAPLYGLMRVLQKWQHGRATNATADGLAADALPPLWLPFAAMAVTVLATLTGAMTLAQLPESIVASQVLMIGGSLLVAIGVGVLLWLVGQLHTYWCNVRRGERINAAPMAADWWAVAGLAAMVTVPLMVIFSPSPAGWLVWRDQLRGYDSAPLRITLQPQAGAAQPAADRAEQERVLLQVAQPVLERGARTVRDHMRTRNGTTTTVDAVPARYRWDGDTLEIRLANPMTADELQRQLSVFQALAQSQPVDASLMAYAQCAPSGSLLAYARFLGRGSDVFAESRSCMETQLRVMLVAQPLLQGQIAQVQVQPTRWFSPWWALHRWTAQPVPPGVAS